MRYSPFLAAVVFAAAHPASAQIAPASIAGSVLAVDGSALPGAVVTLRPPAPGAPVRVTSGERGLFLVSALAPGLWDLSVELPGFLPASRSGITLAPGDRKTVEIRMSLATRADSVTVLGATPRDSVEASTLRESPARDVGEALAVAPGVSKLRKGGIANDVVVRGYQAKDLTILIDGARLYGACPNHMDPPAFHADFAEVDRVEIAKGPFDVRNAGSLGGVVNIVTRQPEPGWHASPTLSAGSYGYVNPSATVSWGGPGFSALGGISFRESDAYVDGDGLRFTERANYRASAVEASAFRATTAWGKVVVVPASGQSLQVSYTHQESDDVMYPYLQMDGVYDRADRANLSWQLSGGGGLVSAVKAQAFYSRVSHWMTDAMRLSAGTAPTGYSMATKAYARTAGGRIETSLGPVTAGVDGSARDWDATTEMAMTAYVPQASLPGAETTLAGVFAEWKQGGTDRLSFSAGIRLDQARTSADPEKANTDLWWAYNSTRSTSATDTYPSGNVRAVFRAAEGIEISGGAGSNVRVPEPNERYYALRRMGNDWVGNPALSPSRNTGLDLAASLRRSRLFVSVGLFSDWVADYVTVHAQPRVNMAAGVMNSSARSYANVDATFVGGEAQAVLTVTDRIFISGNLSYVRGRQEEDPARNITSPNVAEMPPLNGRAALRYDTGRLSAELEGVFSSSQEDVDASLGETRSPGWGIANLKVGLQAGGFSVTAGVSNVFDRAYFESLSYQRDPFRNGTRVYEPGRNLWATVGYRF